MIPIVSAAAFIFRKKIISLTVYFPKCFFNEKTGYLCPACGNTRSVKALLGGHFITAAEYNIMPPLLLSLFAAFYIELLFACAGKTVRIIPRSYLFLAVLLTAVSLYFLLRNFFPFLTLA